MCVLAGKCVSVLLGRRADGWNLDYTRGNGVNDFMIVLSFSPVFSSSIVCVCEG